MASAAGSDKFAGITEEAQTAQDTAEGIPPADLKIILLGDSAAGKSKLLTRFLEDQYHPRQRSTYALTLYRYDTSVDGRPIAVDFWDTAGQERFASMHASYYYKAHACILVFDVTRKVTYQNLTQWYSELREHCETIPCLCVANKIDVDYAVTSKAFAFPTKNGLPFYFVSAADGTNVVKVFQDGIKAGWAYKHGEKDFVAEVLELLGEDEFRPAVPRPLPAAGVAAAATSAAPKT